MNTDQRFLHESLKMNSEFWLSRGPQNVNGTPTSNNSFPQALMDTSSPSDYHMQRNNVESSANGFHPTSNAPNHNNNNNENSSNNNTPSSNNNVDTLSDNNNRAVDTKDRMLSGRDSQENFGQHSPNEFQLGASTQPNQDPTDSPVAENLSTDLKFNADKFVNEIQVSLNYELLVRCEHVFVVSQLYSPELIMSTILKSYV